MLRILKPACCIVILALVLSLGATLLPVDQAESATLIVTGDTFYVDDDRPDNSGDGLTEATAWKTITYALSQVDDGDEIIVLPGWYYSDETFPLAINEDIYLHSRDGTGGSELTTINTSSYNAAIVIGNNVTTTVEGFIIACAVPADYGIYVHSQTDGDSLTIEDCQIAGFDGDGFHISYIAGDSEVSILNCTIGNNICGIWVGEDGAMSSASLTIEGCEIGSGDLGNDATGIYINSGVYDSTIDITGNTIDDNGWDTEGYGDGIFIYNAYDSSLTISDNTSISGNAGNGINIYGFYVYEGSCEAIISHNDCIEGNGYDGIYFHETSDADITIEDNTITGNGVLEADTGMYFDYVYGDSVLEIIDNTVTENYGGGIGFYEIYGTAEVNIEENTVSNNYAGGYYYDDEGDGIFFGYEEYGYAYGGIFQDAVVTIYNNVIQGNDDDGIDIEWIGGATSPSLDITCNTLSDNDDDGVDINYQEHDYMITVSPCNDIFDNGGYGINNDGYYGYYYWVDATQNWWGDASGPGGVGPGIGDEVSDYVLYGDGPGYDEDQWLPAPCDEEPECETPSASISASITTGEAPLTVQFRGSSDQSDVEYFWSFDTGDNSDSRSPSYTFHNEGTYVVTLTVTNECGEYATDSITILVDDGGAAPSLLVTDLNISPTYANYGEPVYITATVSNVGGSWGSDDVELLINGQFEQSFPVGLAAGTSQTVDFTVYKTEAREYQVSIGAATGTFYLMEQAAQQTQSSGLLAGGDLGTGGIIAIICIGVILIAGIVLVFLFARRA